MHRILILSILALAAAGAHAESRMQPGLWEFTNTMTTPKAPKPQTATIKRCITEKEVRNPALLQTKQARDCKIRTKGKSAGGHAWEMDCPKSGMKGSGTMRYGKGTLEGETTIAATSGGEPVEITTKTKGRRLGPCKKE